MQAHICSYYFYNNRWPNGIVRHKCHNKLCCNPKHLEQGSNADNVRDSLLDGIIGKLNWDQVNSLRLKFSENPKISRIELVEWFKDKYNILMAPNNLIDICLNKMWKDDNYTPPDRPDQRTKLNLAIVIEIRKLYNTIQSCEGINKFLNEKYNINMNPAYIHQILNNVTWHDENYIPPYIVYCKEKVEVCDC